MAIELSNLNWKGLVCMDREEVMQIIQEYPYYAARLQEVQERLFAMCYKVTPTYGQTASATGGNVSKVETYALKQCELKDKEEEYQQKIAYIQKLINESGLNEAEKGVMWWSAKYGRLSAYARREHIGRYNVYKIRDRAIEKIIAADKPQNVGSIYKNLQNGA